MKIFKRPRDLKEQADIENAIAQVEKNKANIDYVAMMTDVEIPVEEEAHDESDV